MTIKQIAERLGVKVAQVDFELSNTCRSCTKFGGNIAPECKLCKVLLFANIVPEIKK